MSTSKLTARNLICALSGALLVSIGLCQPAMAQTGMTPDEKAAVQLVRDWFAAWNTKDTDKVASYLAPNVEFRYQMGSPLCHGPGPVLARYKFIMSLGAVVSNVQTFAVADRIGAEAPKGWGVAVLSSRTDTLNLRSGHVPLTASGFFIIAHGKIQAYFEGPAQSLGGGAPLQLAGGRPAPAPPRPCEGGT